MNVTDPLLAPVEADEHREIGGVQVDVARTGACRVKRLIYPPGFHWAKHLSELMGSKYCMHAHVGFMAHGQINVRFADGCVVEYKAPKFVQVEPEHEGWVVGDEPAVLIEFDFEGDTLDRLGVPQVHYMHGVMEPWLRGPLAGVHPLVAPTLHAFAQAREDLAHWTDGLTDAEIWLRPHGLGASRISTSTYRGQRGASDHLPARRATHARTIGGNPSRDGSRARTIDVARSK